MRWLRESDTKRSIETDKIHLRWLDHYLRNFHLYEINRDVLEKIALEKEAEGVSASTVNRVFEVVRAILNRAYREWEWLDKVPAVRMRKIEKGRIRWLTMNEANHNPWMSQISCELN